MHILVNVYFQYFYTPWFGPQLGSDPVWATVVVGLKQKNNFTVWWKHPFPIRVGLNIFYFFCFMVLITPFLLLCNFFNPTYGVVHSSLKASNYKEDKNNSQRSIRKEIGPSILFILTKYLLSGKRNCCEHFG